MFVVVITNYKKKIKNVLHAEILTGSNIKCEMVFIPLIDLAQSETNLPFQLNHRQFPVIPAFVITINKSQSFNRVGVYLLEPVFAHVKLYVALSRTKNPEHLKLLISPQHNQGHLKMSM